VTAVIEIYTGHVDSINHFHIKTCRLQTFSHDLRFPGDEAQRPRLVVPLKHIYQHTKYGHCATEGLAKLYGIELDLVK
jgi:hypothetical protein